MSIFRRFTNLFTHEKVQREIDAELRSHLEMRIDDNLAAGMPATEARREALLRFGNRAVIQEHTTEADAALVLESLWLDLRYALRQLRKNPGFTATAILMIALGLGPLFVGWVIDRFAESGFALAGLGSFGDGCPGGAAAAGAGAPLQSACQSALALASRRGLLVAVGFFAWAVVHYFLAAAGIGRSLRAAASSVQSDSM